MSTIYDSYLRITPQRREYVFPKAQDGSASLVFSTPLGVHKTG